MWSARARWKVYAGELHSAVSLTQGTHANWDDVEGAANFRGGESCIILKQAENPSPCEVTVDFPESSFFVSLIKLSSTARTCEVYSRKLGSQDHEYVCTIRGKPEETPLLANPPGALLTQPCLTTPQAQTSQSPGPEALTPVQGIAPQGGAGVKSNGLGQAEAQEGGGTGLQTRLENVTRKEGCEISTNEKGENDHSSAVEPLHTQTSPTSGEPVPDANCPLDPDFKPDLDPNTQSESKRTQSDAPLTPSKPAVITTSKSNIPASLVPFYTCHIKLARGPAFTSLRFKFLSLQEKAELQLRPIRIYASRGPAAVAPPRLTGNSLSALAPLLPALGPLLNSGVSGLPQLPGGFSHLLSAQQQPVSGHQTVENASGTEIGSVNAGSAKGGRTHQGGLPPGLAQLMASFQGLRTGGADSHSAAGAETPSPGPGAKPTGLSFNPLSQFGNAPSGTPGSVTESTTSSVRIGSGVESPNRESASRETAQRTETSNGGESAQQATLEAVLRRLEGLEATCLRIERAVTGAMSSFDARLTRLEARDSARGVGVKASGTAVDWPQAVGFPEKETVVSAAVETEGNGHGWTEDGVETVGSHPAGLDTVAKGGGRTGTSVKTTGSQPVGLDAVANGCGRLESEVETVNGQPTGLDAVANGGGAVGASGEEVFGVDLAGLSSDGNPIVEIGKGAGVQEETGQARLTYEEAEMAAVL